MNIILVFIIPSCFGFIIGRAVNNHDMATVVVAIIGILANVVLSLKMG